MQSGVFNDDCNGAFKAVQLDLGMATWPWGQVPFIAWCDVRMKIKYRAAKEVQCIRFAFRTNSIGIVPVHEFGYDVVTCHGRMGDSFAARKVDELLQRGVEVRRPLFANFLLVQITGTSE